jgi:hypothetical protein
MTQFSSVLPSGHVLNGFPIGNRAKIEGVKLLNPERVIVSLPQLFIMFKGETHEDGMVSLRKPAGFSIQAKNRGLGVTLQDIVDQVPRIVKMIMDNPKVFDMRTWSNYDNLVIQDIWYSPPGHFEMFIAETHGDIASLDVEKLMRITPYPIILTPNSMPPLPNFTDDGEDLIFGPNDWD